ncbi:PIN domain-containing protein [Acetobacter conturbans]|uniref:PIN domain-containing protein n=1 Tax=Acetobacter conturbans TaxID=1737472 RepID=UPI001568E91D
MDTNLFHECQSLSADDFPWGEIGDFNTIELIVTDPVLSELDRQKKDQRPRIKRRAVEAIAWVRAMLQSSADEHVFRQNTPRVLMRVSAQTPSLSHPNVLDLAVDDDRIVGVALALTRENPGKDIRILSDDTRPIAKSKALSIPFNFIPSSWKRPAEVDDQQKEISRLQAEITALQSTHPVISLHADGVINRRITLSRTAFRPPSHEEINLLRNALRGRVTLGRVVS